MGSDENGAFHADAPITSASQDLLNRGGIAAAIARAINGWRGDESLVVGLSGSWGSGKSSIKNLVAEALKKLPDRPYVLEFNPWQWAGQRLLIEAFFKEIFVALGLADPSEKGRKLARQFKSYAALLQTTGFVAGGVSTSIPYLLPLLSLAGLAIFLSAAPAAIKWIAGVGLGLAWAGTLLSNISKYFEARADALDLTLPERKDKLRRSLAASHRPLLIVIDDIDRLTPAEVRVLLQLIKANLDLPKLVFLLLYDRGVVEKFLSTEGFPGTEYLEKIVQVPFDVPGISKAHVQRVLFSGIDKIFEAVKIPLDFDQVRWGNLFHGPLGPYFEDLRSVYRFLATLDFHVRLFIGASRLEVNAIDLIAVEALRVFEPEAYSRVRTAKSAVTGTEPSSAYGSTKAASARKATVDAIINSAPEDRRDRVKDLLTQLFPRLEAIYGNVSHGEGSAEKWEHSARVCSAEKFDRYFQLALSAEEMSEFDIAELIAATALYNDFIEIMDAFGKRNVTVRAMEVLDSYKQKIPIENAKEFLPAIIDLADKLPEDDGMMSPTVRAFRIVHWYLQLLKDSALQGKVLVSAYENATGLALLASLIANDDAREKKGETTNFTVDSTSREQLRDIWLQKVRAKSADPTAFLNLSSSAHVLFRWLDWGKPDEVRAWVNAHVTSPATAMRLLVALNSRGTTQTAGDRVARVIWRINMDALGKLIDPSQLEKLVGSVDPESLPQDEKLAFDAWQRALKRLAEGKTGDSLMDDD